MITPNQMIMLLLIYKDPCTAKDLCKICNLGIELTETYLNELKERNYIFNMVDVYICTPVGANLISIWQEVEGIKK